MKIIEGLKKRKVPAIRAIEGPLEPGARREWIYTEDELAVANHWFPHSKKLKLENDKRVVLPTGWTRPKFVGRLS